jgi:tRNA nucleotidyltransferase (CCA-adding enzyme)
LNLADGIEAIPGMQLLLSGLADTPACYLVGGAVRDLLRGLGSVDLDICVEGDALETGAALAKRLGGSLQKHERFGTATVTVGSFVIDLATARTERYERPGALPCISPAAIEQDLARRDFTINAMAVSINGMRFGALLDPCDGQKDLSDKTVRVLHTNSFIDDPTRLLRAVRYEARLGFAMDRATEDLARSAAAAHALTWVSGRRIRDQLFDLFEQSQELEALRRVSTLGLDEAMCEGLRVDASTTASAKHAARSVGADPTLSCLAAFVRTIPHRDRWLSELELDADSKARVAKAADVGPRLVAELADQLSGAELYDLLHPHPPEALAVAIAEGAALDPVLLYTQSLRDVALEIDGTDILNAGVSESEAVGKALEKTLRLKLDGQVSGRTAELGVAVELARASDDRS